MDTPELGSTWRHRHEGHLVTVQGPDGINETKAPSDANWHSGTTYEQEIDGEVRTRTITTEDFLDKFELVDETE